MSSKYDAIVFDLGQVLLNVNDAIYEDLFAEDDGERIREWETKPLSDSQIDSSEYLDIIGNWSISNVWFARTLRKMGFRTYIFSNTSLPHYLKFVRGYENLFGKRIEQDFDGAFYSFRMGHRKPDQKAYDMVRAVVGDNALFVDDRLTNLNFAPATWDTIHLTNIDELITQVKRKIAE